MCSVLTVALTPILLLLTYVYGLSWVVIITACALIACALGITLEREET